MPASWRVRGGLSRSARAAAARPTHVRAPRTLTRIKTAGARRAHHGGMYTSRAAAMSAPIALDEARLAILVDRFYDRVRADVLLGPVFDAAVHDWPAHKRRLTAFWCSVVLRSASYHGNPMAMHRGHPIGSAHFERWLALWSGTVHELLDAPAAARLCACAQRIGRGLQLGLGLLPAPGRSPAGAPHGMQDRPRGDRAQP